MSAKDAPSWKPTSLTEVDLFQDALVTGGGVYSDDAGSPHSPQSNQGESHRRGKRVKRRKRKSPKHKLSPTALTARYQRVKNGSTVPPLPSLHPSLQRAVKEQHTTKSEPPPLPENSVTSKDELIAIARARHLRAIEVASRKYQMQTEHKQESVPQQEMCNERARRGKPSQQQVPRQKSQRERAIEQLEQKRLMEAQAVLGGTNLPQNPRNKRKSKPRRLKKLTSSASRKTKRGFATNKRNAHRKSSPSLLSSAARNSTAFEQFISKFDLRATTFRHHVPRDASCDATAGFTYRFHSPWITYGAHRLVNCKSEMCFRRWSVVQFVIENELHTFARLKYRDARSHSSMLRQAVLDFSDTSDVALDTVLNAADAGDNAAFADLLQNHAEHLASVPLELMQSLFALLVIGTANNEQPETTSSPEPSSDPRASPRQDQHVPTVTAGATKSAAFSKSSAYLSALASVVADAEKSQSLPAVENEDVGILLSLKVVERQLDPASFCALIEAVGLSFIINCDVSPSQATLRVFEQLCVFAHEKWGLLGSGGQGYMFVKWVGAACRDGHGRLLECLLSVFSTVKSTSEGHSDIIDDMHLPTAAEVVRRSLAHVLSSENDDDPAVLAQAVVFGHVGVLKQLLSAGASVCAQSTISGFSLVHLAVCSGQFHVLQYLLELGADSGLRGCCNVAPLEIATFWGLHDAVAPLVNAGSSCVDHADPNYGNTLAMMSLLNGDFDMVQILVDAGASLSRQNNFGMNIVDLLQVYFFTHPEQGFNKDTSLEQVLALGTTMRVQWASEAKKLPKVLADFQRNSGRLSSPQLQKYIGGAAANESKDVGSHGQTTSPQRKAEGKTILQLVCSRFLKLTCNEDTGGQAVPLSDTLNSTGGSQNAAVEAATSMEEDGDSQPVPSYSHTDLLFWMGFATRLRCSFAHQMSQESPSYALGSAKKAASGRVKSPSDLDVLAKLYFKKFDATFRQPASEVEAAALRQWEEVLRCRLWCAPNVEFMHPLVVARNAMERHFQEDLSDLKKRYCDGAVDVHNRIRQHSSWRRTLLELFESQCRNRVVLRELQGSQGSPSQGARKSFGKHSKRSKKSKHKKRAMRQDMAVSRKQSAAALQSAIALSTKVVKLPTAVTDCIAAVDAFAEGDAVTSMTSLHELESLHWYMRRQANVFDSDLRAQISGLISLRQIEETRIKNERLAAKFAAEQARIKARDAREAAMDSDDDDSTSSVKKPLVRRNSSSVAHPKPTGSTKQLDDPVATEFELLSACVRGRDTRVKKMLVSDYQSRSVYRKLSDLHAAHSARTSPTAQSSRSHNFGTGGAETAAESIHDEVKKCFRRYVNINFAHESGHTPLLSAILSGDASIVTLVLASGANVDQVSTVKFQKLQHFSRNVDSVSFVTYPLLLATLLEQLEIVRLLLLWGADANQVLPNGLSAVHAAACHSRDADAAVAANLNDTKVSIANSNFPQRGQLFRLFCDPSYRNKQVQTSSTSPKASNNGPDKLSSSGYAEDSQPHFVEERFATVPIQLGTRVFVHGRSFAGLCPIHVAAFHGRREVLELLLRAGGVLPIPEQLAENSAGNVTGWTLAKRRIDASRCACSELDVTRRTIGGFSALRMALFCSHGDCVNILLRYGALTEVAVPKLRNGMRRGSKHKQSAVPRSESLSALDIACFQGLPATVRALLSSACPSSASAIVIAACFGDYDIISYLYDALERKESGGSAVDRQPTRKASWNLLRGKVAQERQAETDAERQLKRRDSVVRSSLYKRLSPLVEPALRGYHSLDLYTARMVGERTRQFLVDHENEWSSQCKQLFADSPSWFSTLDPMEQSNHRNHRVADSRHVKRVLRELVNDMHLREFTDNFLGKVLEPHADSGHYDAALALVRTHSRMSEAVLDEALSAQGRDAENDTDARNNSSEPGSPREGREGARSPHAQGKDDLAMPVFESDFTALFFQVTSTHPAPIMNPTTFAQVDVYLLCLQVMRYKSLERRRIAVDARVERAAVALQKMARMWGVTAATGRERFRSLKYNAQQLERNRQQEEKKRAFAASIVQHSFRRYRRDRSKAHMLQAHDDMDAIFSFLGAWTSC